MNEIYRIEKWVWSESDFERMGWHDAHLHALAFSPETFELLFDIDYILEWIQPEPGETHFKLWVAPATLVFENVYDVEFDILTSDGIDIDAIHRSDARRPRNADSVQRETEWSWVIESPRGGIKLSSVGYKQYIRTEPRMAFMQKLDLSARGGYSFARGRTDTA